MTRPALKVDSPNAPTIAPPRGPMMDARAIASELFNDTVSPEWVRENVPDKVRLAHRTVRWYRSDVLAWLEKMRKAG
jgi:predicted DNA-binding transcriptional regulator AlpA